MMAVTAIFGIKAMQWDARAHAAAGHEGQVAEAALAARS